MVQQSFAVKKQPSLVRAILLAGLIAGTIDALFAIGDFTISFHRNPVIIFWYIASGALRSEPSIKNMLSANAATQCMYAAAGVIFHYIIAYAFVIFLFIIFPAVKKLLQYNVVIAVVYGIFTWLVMNYIVVPVAITGKMPAYTLKTIVDILFLAIAIGLVGSLAADRYYKRRRN